MIPRIRLIRKINKQRGFGLTGYLAGGAAIAILAVTVLWQMERVKSAKLEATITGLHGELDIMQTNLDSLKASHTEQQATILRMAENDKQQNDRIQELQNQAFDAQAETYEKMQEIERLRATATKRSLMDPYDAGNAAHDRLVDGLRRIGGTTGRDHTNGDDPGSAAAGDSGNTAASPD